MNNTKAIIFDVDGTIMPQGGDFDFMPSERFKNVIKKLRAQGFVIAFATGRAKRHAVHLIKDLEIDQECMISAGTEMIDPETLEIVWRELVPKHTHEHIKQHIRKLDADMATQHDDHAHFSAKDIDQHLNDETTVLFVLGLKPEDADQLERDIAHPDLTVINMHHFKSYELRDVHIHSSKASKEHAAHEFLRRKAIDPSNTIVAGDGKNDLHLFKVGGYKVALGNAAPELKAEADIVIGSVADDGFAEYLESLVENQ